MIFCIYIAIIPLHIHATLWYLKENTMSSKETKEMLPPSLGCQTVYFRKISALYYLCNINYFLICSSDKTHLVEMNVYRIESSDEREAQGKKKSERVHCSPSDGGELGFV